MPFETSTFRILLPNDAFGGMGFLLAPTLAVTCFRFTGGIKATARLKFTGQDEIISATILPESNPADDVAFLRLERAAQGIEPLRLLAAESETAYLTFGALTQAEITGEFKLNGSSESYSGAPVWDQTRNAAIGMIVRIEENQVQMLAAEKLWPVFPQEIATPNENFSPPPFEVLFDPSVLESVTSIGLDDDIRSIESPITTVTYISDDAAGDGPDDAPPAQRVLNVNFTAGEDRHPLPLEEYLRPGEACQLLVDVGLPWDKIANLIREHAEFPEDREVSYLSAEDRQKGWFDVDVAFVSQQFKPNMLSGRIRVPVGSLERSTPYVNGALGHAPGPLQLSLQAPKNRKKQPIRAHGRVCLYYGAQVLQSAILDVGIAPAAKYPAPAAPAENSAKVDYVLTPGFLNVGQNISQRQRSGENGTSSSTTVRVGLMLNDDLSGTHRILLKADDPSSGEIPLPPAWKAYDSTAIANMLEEARRVLANPAGTDLNYESDTFILDEFKEDLLALAKLGAEFYSVLLQGVTPADGLRPLVWRKKFRSMLQAGDVIQLARAGSVPATHIIPWALVYDHPLEPNRSDKPMKLCRVVDEQWSATAKRTAKNQTCPYESEHDNNVVCPFGFWGYKYTLEQPISALLGKNWDVEPARSIRVSSPVKMTVAATYDVPREGKRQQHFQRIHDSVNAEYLPNIPASERDQVRDSMKAPELVYILCHGGKDGDSTFLSIGPRGNDARYTITPELPGAWGEEDYVDLDHWEQTRPLVFINGCYTADLLPDLTLNFVSAFRDLLVGGVIGTEIPVSVEAGYLAGEKFFERLGRGEDVGQSILGMRWDLLNQGSLLGLAYTPYAMSDLRLGK